MNQDRHRRKSTEELFEEYRRTHHRAVRNQLVERHLRLATQVAGDYRHRGVEREDLEQVAMLALVKAVDRFDPRRGSSFAAFASITLNGELKRHFRDHGWNVRPPRAVQEAHLAVRRAGEALVQELGRSPRVDELADYTNLSEDQVVMAMAANNSYRAERLDSAPSTEEEAPARIDRLSTVDTGYRDVDDRLELEGLMEAVSDRDRRIIELRFWEDMTQSEIADEIGVSQMHVSRLLRKTIDDLANAPTAV